MQEGGHVASPLEGVTVVEFAGIGPAPFCAMLLALNGARVVRIERAPAADATSPTAWGPLEREREVLYLDLKSEAGRTAARALLAQSDALIEGFRPGVMERLGLGPADCFALNSRLVYGRMTGWGQSGPLAHMAGHDINYIALSGALHAIGPSGAGPVPPLNLVGDFGGGGMLLAFGLVSAILRARASGQGCVVDAAMTDGAALLMAMIYGYKSAGRWNNERGSNLLDGGAPYYGTYRCADGKWLAVGCIEPQFYAEFLDRLDANPALRAIPQNERRRWPELRERIAAALMARPRDAWWELFRGSDACVTPVLDLDEAPLDIHNAARSTFTRRDGPWWPDRAPRYLPLDG